MYSSSDNGARGFDIFNIQIELTEKGIKHTDDIVNLVFEVLNFLTKLFGFIENIKILNHSFNIIVYKFTTRERYSKMDFR